MGAGGVSRRGPARVARPALIVAVSRQTLKSSLAVADSFVIFVSWHGQLLCRVGELLPEKRAVEAICARHKQTKQVLPGCIPFFLFVFVFVRMGIGCCAPPWWRVP